MMAMIVTIPSVFFQNDFSFVSGSCVEEEEGGSDHVVGSLVGSSSSVTGSSVGPVDVEKDSKRFVVRSADNSDV